MDADLRTTPGPFPVWWPPSIKDSICRSAPATSPAARFRTGTGTAGCLSQGGNIYAAALLGLGIKDSTSGFRAYRAEILRVDRSAGCAGRGLRVPDRDGAPGARPRWSGRSRCRSASSTGSRVNPRCPSTSWSRRSLWSHGGRHCGSFGPFGSGAGTAFGQKHLLRARPGFGRGRRLTGGGVIGGPGLLRRTCASAIISG